MGRNAEDMYVPGGHFRDKQHVHALEEDRVGMEEVAGQQSVCPVMQERPP